jgi:hypothetical protein
MKPYGIVLDIIRRSSSTYPMSLSKEGEYHTNDLGSSNLVILGVVFLLIERCQDRSCLLTVVIVLVIVSFEIKTTEIQFCGLCLFVDSYHQ